MQIKIKTIEQAYAYLNRPFLMPDVSMLPDSQQKAIIAICQLYTLTEALNQEANDGKPWLPVYDGSEWHYFPWFLMNNKEGQERGSGFRFDCYAYDYQYSSVGSRLEFISAEVCEYAAENFLELYRDAFVLSVPGPTRRA